MRYISISSNITIKECIYEDLDCIVSLQQQWAKEYGIERSLIYSSTKDMDSIIKFYKKHDYKTWYIQMFK